METTFSSSTQVLQELKWTTLASETLRHPPHNINSYTTCNVPQIPTRVYPDITAPHYAESTT